MKELQVRNRQRARRINLPVVREISTTLLEDLVHLPDYELAIHFVSARRMAEVNQQFLQHEGPTDVITFDLADEPANAPGRCRRVRGEIFVCIEVAEEQAMQFGTTWQAEVVRYIAHGVLHLLGHDDLEPEKRRVMKRKENRLVTLLERRFRFTRVGR